jgi:hypothetical protein
VADDIPTRGPAFRFETQRNLAMISWRDAPFGEVKELASRIESFRDSSPAGSAIFNLIAAEHPAGVKAAWVRMGAVFLTAPRKSAQPAVHLGTAHLFSPVGLRAATTRALFHVLSAHGRDFETNGNVVTRSLGETCDWLLARLAEGPVVWRGFEVREALERFCDGERPQRAPSARAHP